jgi:ADP-dependent phosphofructokinase/glucokinase
MSSEDSRLITGIRQIAERTGEDLRAAEREVLDELLTSLESIQGLDSYTVNVLKFSGLKSIIANTWHRRFMQVLNLLDSPMRQTRVLCAFGYVVDRVYMLDSETMDTLDKWCCRHAQNRNGNASSTPDNLLNIPADIPAALKLAFQTQGLKPVVDNFRLRDELRRKFPLKNARSVLGGAPGIIAEVFAELGVDSRVYTMYHSAEQAARFRRELRTKRLDLSSPGPQYVPASRVTESGHPTRHTFVLAYPQGLHLKSENVHAASTDRSLLLLRSYYGKRTWKSCTIDGLPYGSPAIEQPDAPEWPSVMGFVSWRITTDSQPHLEIEFVSDDIVRQLAQEHHYVILGSPGVRQLQTPSEPLTAALLRQIRVLAAAGTTLHLEMSGGADRKKDRLEPFVSSLRGVVRSVGINDKELDQIAALPDFSLPNELSQADSAAPGVYCRYLRALAFARSLCVERLYVHGNDVDLILRKGVNETALQHEIHADLFAKCAVVVSILLRNQLDPATNVLTPALYHRGFAALIEFAWRHAQRVEGSRKRQEDLFRQVCDRGYYLPQDRTDYAVAVVPVMWPEQLRRKAGIDTTGAGDTCSGISLLYSGWR